MADTEPPGPAGKSLWSEYKSPDGRTYWSHSVTKQSVWEKPDDLKTPFEKALAKTPWKQYTSKDRPYYVNSLTKKTTWELPPELEDLKRQVEAEEIAKREREHLKSLKREKSPSATPYSESLDQVEDEKTDIKVEESSTALTRYLSPTPPPPSLPIPEVVTMPHGGFKNQADAEIGFIYLLKREGIDETWTWDQTMRKIVLDPLYKALDTLAQKKAAFEKYIKSIIDDRQAIKDARIAKIKPVLHKMFVQSGQIKSYSTMKTANQVFANEKIWRDAPLDERQIIFQEYVNDLRKKEETAERELKKRNLDTLTKLIRTLDITISTRWRKAHDIIINSEEYRSDDKLRLMPTMDILRVYDDYSHQLEKEHEEESRRFRAEQIRRARKARDGFRALLSELTNAGKLTRKTKWKEIRPDIINDERYLALLGLPGSNPIELWMDAVDDLQEEAEKGALKMEQAVRDAGKEEITIDMTLEQVNDLLASSKVDLQMEEKAQADAFDLIHSRLVQAAAEEERRAERKRRHRIDDLRYALKKVQKHIDLEMSYEDAVPFMRDLPEYQDITEEEDRKIAFDKFIKRQKERLREAEGSDAGSARDDKERNKEKDRDSGRDRDERKHSSSSRHEREHRDYRDKDKDKDEKEKEKDRRDKDRERDRDRDRVDVEKEREKRREREREDRRSSYDYEHRRDKDRDGDRHRDREKDRDGKSYDRDRDRDGERESRGRERDLSDDRDAKRRRLSGASRNGAMEVEEGEI